MPVRVVLWIAMVLLAVGCTAKSNNGSQTDGDAGIVGPDGSDAAIAPTADSSPDAQPMTCDPEHGICRYGGVACPCPPPTGCGHPGQPCCVGYVFYFDQCDPASGVQCIDGMCRADGTPCTSDANCGSGICLQMPSGDRCSWPCTTDLQCLAGWTCLPLGDAGSAQACQCTVQSEVCNGKDDDCDGSIDEPSPQDINLDCTGKFSCDKLYLDGEIIGGACVCHFTECGGDCVNTSTDPAHCGGCGQACAPGQVCKDFACI